MAAQKETNVKIAHLRKARRATILCKTPCKFGVMAKVDYQNVLDNVDRRTAERLRDFLKQLPFFNVLPHAIIRNLYLYVKKVTY